MYNLTKIVIQDFKTFAGEHEYTFQQNQSLLIKAINNDTEGADSNGSGKSNFLKAITFGFLGLFDKSEPLERYINNNSQSATVIIFLEDDNNSIKVTRTIFRSKSKGAKMTIEVNDEIDETVINEKIGTKILLDMIGIDYDDLLNYYIINQSNSNGFLKQSDSEQKAIIARFTKLDIIDEVLTGITKQITEHKQNISALNGAIFLSSEQRNFLLNEVDNLEVNFKKDIQEKVAYKMQQIEEVKIEVGEYKDQVESFKLDNKRLLNQAKEQFEQDIIALTAQIKLLESEKAILLSESSEIEEMMSTIESSMKTFIVCPSCSHSFTLSYDLTKEQLNESLIELQDLFSDVKKKIKDANKSIESNEVLYQKQKGIEEKTKRTSDIIKQNDKQIAKAEKRCAALLEKITKLLKEIENLSQSEFDNNTVTRAKDEAETIARELIEKQSQVDMLESKITTLRFWEYNIGLNGFKTFLINKVLSSIEGYINMYLKKFNINLVVEIKGYKILGSGEVREKITVFVEQDGIIEPFSSLSGGQKSRLNICCILALQKLINNSCKSGGLNLLILDETFEGLDVSGQIATMKMLEKCGTTNLVVSHSNDNIPCKKLIIERRDGKSKIGSG